MKIKSKRKKQPTIILTPELQTFRDAQGEHGMGCLFEDDALHIPLTQKEWDELTSPEKIAVAQELPCPVCGAYLDYNAYKDKYECQACGYSTEPITVYVSEDPYVNPKED